MSQTISRGRFAWYELLTRDPPGAAALYTDLIGWRATPWEGGDEPYPIWMVNDTPVASLMKLPEDAA